MRREKEKKWAASFGQMAYRSQVTFWAVEKEAELGLAGFMCGQGGESFLYLEFRIYLEFNEGTR